QRLDELQVHLFREPADVVMALDHRARPFERHAFDDVGIEGSLHEPFRMLAAHAAVASDALGFVLEDLHEDTAYRLALSLGVRHAAERGEKALARVDRDEVQMKALAERGGDLDRLPTPQEPIVDEDA